jgi:hypothetical protein
MALTEHRAEQLAQLTTLDITLPAPVTTAISGYASVMRMPAPPVPERGAAERAIRATADQLARHAMTGKQPAPPPQPLDVTPVRQARQDDTDALDRAALHRELRAAAALVLCETFSSSPQAITAIQARHSQVMGELARHARLLPEGADDSTALEAGGQHRESYLAARDLATLAARLREAVRLIEDHSPFDVSDSLELCLGYERTGQLYRRAWLAPSSTTVYGPLGSLDFWLSACREPGYEFWLPSAAELRAHANRMREQMHAARVRGLDPQHVF